MAQLFSMVEAIFTTAGFFALVNVMLIDIVMSGDNAIVIGLATKNLHGSERKRAIAFGIALATILRIAFACTAVMLLQVVGLKFAGGLLLLYVAWKFYQELRSERKAGREHVAQQGSGLTTAIWLIVLADVSMSLDNVLAVAGAARENLLILGIGLVFSIILMAVASNYIATKMDQFPQIQWLGLMIILFVAIEMLLSGSDELEEKLFHVNILPFASVVLGLLGLQLHAKYVKPANEKKIADWCSRSWRGIAISGLFLLLSMCFFGDKIRNFFVSHPAALYFMLVIFLFFLIEIISTIRAGRKPE